MKLWRGFFCAAALFNILGGTVGFWSVERQLAAGFEPPRYPFAFQLLFLFVIILGIGFLMVARDPKGQRGIVWLGLLAKTAGLAMSFHALGSGQLPPDQWWQPLVADLPWILGCGWFLWSSR